MVRAPTPRGPLRVISYNVRGCRGYPESPAAARFPENTCGHIAAAIAAELSRCDPDIVTLQEAPPAGEVAALADRLGMDHAFFDGGYPGALLARHEIETAENAPWGRGDAGDLFTRHAGAARLSVRGEPVHVFSVHLHPKDAAVRARETAVLIEAVRARPDAASALLLQGDLNHDPAAPEYERWIGAGLVDTLAAAGDRMRATKPSTGPTVRLDYIFAGGVLRQRIRDSRVLCEGAFGVTSPAAGSFALSDHLPVLAAFE